MQEEDGTHEISSYIIPTWKNKKKSAMGGLAQ